MATMTLSAYDLATIGSALMDDSRKELKDDAPALAWNSASLAARVYRALGNAPECVTIADDAARDAYFAMMAKRASTQG